MTPEIKPGFAAEFVDDSRAVIEKINSQTEIAVALFGIPKDIYVAYMMGIESVFRENNAQTFMEDISKTYAAMKAVEMEQKTGKPFKPESCDSCEIKEDCSSYEPKPEEDKSGVSASDFFSLLVSAFGKKSDDDDN